MIKVKWLKDFKSIQYILRFPEISARNLGNVSSINFTNNNVYFQVIQLRRIFACKIIFKHCCMHSSLFWLTYCAIVLPFTQLIKQEHQLLNNNWVSIVIIIDYPYWCFRSTSFHRRTP